MCVVITKLLWRNRWIRDILFMEVSAALRTTMEK
jgi:hypothetical protein